MKSSFRGLGVVRIVKSVTTTDEVKKTFIYVEYVNGRKVIRIFEDSYQHYESRKLKSEVCTCLL